MDIKTQCPKCQREYRLVRVNLGRQAKCVCGHFFLIEQATDNQVKLTQKKQPSTQDAQAAELYSIREVKQVPAICAACGAEMPAGAVLCIKCGFDTRTRGKHTSEIEAPAPSDSPPTSRRWLWASFAGVGVLVVAIAIVTGFVMRSKPPKATVVVDAQPPVAVSPASKPVPEERKSSPASRASPAISKRDGAEKDNPQETPGASASAKRGITDTDKPSGVAGREGNKTAGNTVTVVRKDGVPIIRYSPNISGATGQNEHPCLLVFLTPRTGWPLDEDVAAAVGEGIVFHSPITNRVIGLTTITDRKSGDRLGYRFDDHDTGHSRIHDGSTVELALAGTGAQIDWNWIAPNARVWAAIVACRNDGDYTFQRFLSDPTRVDFEYAPAEQKTAEVQETLATFGSERNIWSVSGYVLPTYNIVLAMRPVKILTSPLLKTLPQENKQQLDAAINQLHNECGVDLERMNELIISSDGERNLVCASFKSPMNTQSLLQKQGAYVSEKYKNVTVYRSARSNELLAFPQPSTILLCNDITEIRRAIGRPANVARDLDLPAQGDMVLRVKNFKKLAELLGSGNLNAQDKASSSTNSTSLLPKGVTVPDWARNIIGLTCVVGFSDGLAIQVAAETEQVAHAKEITAQLNGMKWALSATFAQQKESGQIKRGSPEDQVLSKILLQDFVANEREVQYSISLDKDFLSAIGTLASSNQGAKASKQPSQSPKLKAEQPHTSSEANTVNPNNLSNDRVRKALALLGEPLSLSGSFPNWEAGGKTITTIKTLLATDKLPISFPIAAAEVTAICPQCGFSLTVSEHPRITEIIKILGKADGSEVKDFISYSNGELSSHGGQPVTWYKYGWLHFGVVDGTVRAVRAQCSKLIPMGAGDRTNSPEKSTNSKKPESRPVQVASGKVEPWQRNWREFGPALSTAIESAIKTSDALSISPATDWCVTSRCFDGRTVEWTANVSAVHADSTSRTGAVLLKMDRLTIFIDKRIRLTADCLTLRPSPDEWHEWLQIQQGTMVTFRTTLRNQGAFPCVIGWASPSEGSNDRGFLMITTQGGRLLSTTTNDASGASTPKSASDPINPNTGKSQSTIPPRTNSVQSYCLLCSPSTRILKIEKSKIYAGPGLSDEEKYELDEKFATYVLVDTTGKTRAIVLPCR